MPTPPGQPQPFNITPVSAPTHPAHVEAGKAMARAFGHVLTGNHAEAEKHAHDAIHHWFSPHIPTAPAAPAAPKAPTQAPKAAQPRKRK